MEEAVVNVGAAFVPHAQPAEPVQPRQGAFHDPAVVPEPLARVDPRARDAAEDVPRAEACLVDARAVGLVGVQLGGALARGRPRRRATATTKSTMCSSSVPSLTFAALSSAASGTPRASVRR